MTTIVQYVSENPEEWIYEVHCQNRHYLCDLTGKELKELGIEYPNTLPNAKGGGWSLPFSPTYKQALEATGFSCVSEIQS